MLLACTDVKIACRYGTILTEMLRTIRAFQKRQSGGGRGLEEQGSSRGGLTGMLTKVAINGVMQAVAGASGSGSGSGSGGPAGVLGNLLQQFLGAGGTMKGQTPQLSGSEPFDLNMPMHL
jgi:hypothetical protein